MPPMKQLRKITFALWIASIFVLCTASVGSCLQYSPMSPQGPPMRLTVPGGAPCPPPMYCPPPTCPPPPCGPGKQPFRLTAQVGYGHFGLDFNTRPPAIELDSSTPFGVIRNFLRTGLDFSLTDANVPMGSVEIRAESCSGFFLASRLQANAPRDVGVKTSEAPLGGDVTFDATTLTIGWVSPRRWDGSNFQWWTLDTDLGYRVTPCWSVLAGLRRDKLTVGLVNPRDASDQLINLDFATAGPFYLTREMHTDFSSELWVPYVGVEYTGRCCRASLLWGPYAWADMKVPYRYSLSLNGVPPAGDYALQLWFDFDYQCKNLKTANLLEYNFEYDLNVCSNFAVQFWTRGNWQQLSWNGKLDEFFGLRIRVPQARPPLPTVFYVAEPHHSDVDTVNYTKWMISGGIGTVLFF